MIHLIVDRQLRISSFLSHAKGGWRVFFLLMFLVPALSRGQEDSLAITEADDFVTASLLVATPSDVLYSCVGHSSIRMQCPHYDLDVVYTYESEPVTDKVLTFLKGDLKMGMTAVPTERVLADYGKEGRGVTEIILTIPLDKRKQLWQYLDEKVEEGMKLPYDYLNRSCAFACLRAIRTAVLPDTLSFGVWDERLVGKSRRALFGDRTDDFPWNRLIVYSLTGTEADKMCAVTDKVVLPSDLIDVLRKASLNGKPVLGSSNTLVSQTVNVEPAGWFTPMVLAVILLMLAIMSCFWMQMPLSYLLLSVQSLLGLAVTYLVVFSTLPNTEFSWLIIPFNVLPLLLWRWRRWWLLPFAVICIGWSIAMLIRVGNPLVESSYIVLALALAINYLGQKIKLQNKLIKLNKQQN